jgi:serine-type D-Ala-D-Ala carboxypeptidase
MKNWERARKILQEAVETRAFPGAAFGVWSDGAAAAEAIGRFTYKADAPEVVPETVYDIASVTKVAATTAMAMLLYEREALALDERVVERLPEFSGGGKEDVTVRMLLAHSSGLPAHRRLYELPEAKEPDVEKRRAALMRAAVATPLEAAPGSASVYSDIGFIVLEQWLEKIVGDRIDDFCAREIYGPLEMANTKYRPARAERGKIPPTTDDELRHAIVQGEVYDQNCFALGGVAAHAGLFSNAQDLLKFAASMLGCGRQIVSAETVATFSERQQPHGSSRALGWDTPSPQSQAGTHFSERTIGHLGYTGTSLWIDRARGVAIVLLTNRVYTPELVPHASPSKLIQQVRPAFHDAVMEELGI